MHEGDCPTRIPQLARRLSAAAIAMLITGVPVVAAAENAIDEAQVAAGRVWYEKYCTPCHGSGGGPGSGEQRS